MTSQLYACAHAAEFPAQALLRLRADLAHTPIAVLDGRPLQQTVCALNRAAQRLGATHGMTRLEAEAMGSVKLLARAPETESAARAVFLECAAQFSPSIEEAGAGVACAFVLDIAGTERLFGTPRQLAGRLRAALAAAGFRVSIAASANYDAARMKAANGSGIVVLSPGEEAAALEKLPVAALALAPEHQEIFALWGIRTLGELAALPQADLVARLGPQSSQWRALARGAAPHTFQPIEPELLLEEFYEFENPVEQLDSLLFMAARMIDCLTARAAARALLLATLTIHMKLEDGMLYERTLHPALPSGDRKFLLKLLQLEIGAHPPPAAVLALKLAAQAGQPSTVQLGLFAPQTPEPSRLDVTIARLKALAGDGRVGAPVLEDTHRPNSFRMENFSIENWQNRVQSARDADHDSSLETASRMALRRVRPPAAVSVTLRAGKPAAFRDAGARFEVVAAYGPWHSSGCWWGDDEWDSEEWDVLATRSDGASAVCLLSCDRARNRWHLEAFYD